MPVKQYHKLVRDNIPAIIAATGASCETEILSDAEYLRLLDAKLDEELAEYQQSKSLEELADLMEVIRAVVKARGFSLEELEAIRSQKAAQRGGFEEKIFLMEVKTGEE
jgi:predicted house-cleaning noncanonical NTP pyrophosphatase (MazG superfamily)